MCTTRPKRAPLPTATATRATSTTNDMHNMSTNTKRPPRPSSSPSPAAAPPASRRRSPHGERSGTHSALATKLDLDSAFFWLLLAFLLTAFTFLSLRDTHLSLNTAQLAEYERRSQFLSNSTVYIVEVGRPEALLNVLSAQDWKRISVDVDLVAFVWDDLPVFLTDGWIQAAESVLKHDSQWNKNISMVSFQCGCVIPAAYFTLVDERLAGFECVLLAGWVLDSSHVHWLDVQEGDACKRREGVLNSRLARRYRAELAHIHDVVNEHNQRVEQRGGEMS
eukprot:TRINITY_DN444_c5_g1_i1.p2 TRINITY_DN444_c5_g1~~TRINITY_DN444_c5_g1_i1.p2  ORF type:complete len:279 (+),score=43.22 TRINITY_DN444_c5_g1_i1:1516-2352(+)